MSKANLQSTPQHPVIHWDHTAGHFLFTPEVPGRNTISVLSLVLTHKPLAGKVLGISTSHDSEVPLSVSYKASIAVPRLLIPS